VFGFEDRPNVLSIPYMFGLLLNTLHVWDIHRTQRFLSLIRRLLTLELITDILDGNCMSSGSQLC
jgi:hypothetical protein